MQGTTQQWAKFLAENVSDLGDIAEGERPSSASQAFFEATRKSDSVFRYVIFNRYGYSQLVIDHDRIARRPLGIQPGGRTGDEDRHGNRRRQKRSENRN